VGARDKRGHDERVLRAFGMALPAGGGLLPPQSKNARTLRALAEGTRIMAAMPQLPLSESNKQRKKSRVGSSR
jgi:hypothetical protein